MNRHHACFVVPARAVRVARVDRASRARLRAAAATDPGRGRTYNEDGWLARPRLVAVADGMGGRQAGEVASAIALARLEAWLADDDRLAACEGAPAMPADPPDALVRGFAAANAAILAAAALRPGCLGMGSTLSAAWLVGARLWHAHVGDSRIYLWRQGGLNRLTRDHTVGQAMADAGALRTRPGRPPPGAGVLTRALGVAAAVSPDVGSLELRPGDRLLLCTDGVSDVLADAALADLMSQRGEPAQAAGRMVAAALDAGGADNVTAMVVDFQGGVPARRTVRAGRT